MTTGVPYFLHCPKCKRGTLARSAPVRGVRRTGTLEKRVVRLGGKRRLNGGFDFEGHRAEVECLDCGHKWFSSHPDSGRKYV